MRALVLKNTRELVVDEIATPVPGPHEVLLRVDAVGVCGTDLHIYEGSANYNTDAFGVAIPLETQSQILGHEFCGTIERMGEGVAVDSVGQRVIVDQVLTCVSQGRKPVCEFCETGDAHQCEYGVECGITGIQGALAEYIVVPSTNTIPIPKGVSVLAAAMVEPLGCILHASDRMEKSANRFWLDGRPRIDTVLILGAGPAGLLFLQYLREIQKFQGKIIVADKRHRSLELARKLGAVAVDVSRGDPSEQILAANEGRRVEYLIEATGNGSVFDWLPRVARRQATLLLYGAGHGNLRAGCLTPWQAMEFTIVTAAGASGRIGSDGAPQTYANALAYIANAKVDVDSLITHRYPDLEQLAHAFTHDQFDQEFIKGALVRRSSEDM